MLFAVEQFDIGRFHTLNLYLNSSQIYASTCFCIQNYLPTYVPSEVFIRQLPNINLNFATFFRFDALSLRNKFVVRGTLDVTLANNFKNPSSRIRPVLPIKEVSQTVFLNFYRLRMCNVTPLFCTRFLRSKTSSTAHQ